MLSIKKTLLAGKHLGLIASLSAILIPALMAAAWPDDHLRDLLGQMRLQFIYGALAALALMSACNSWREHLRLSILAVTACLCQILTVASAYIFYPQQNSIRAFVSQGYRSQLTVINSNLYVGNTNFKTFADLVESRRPDVICLQELTLSWSATLAKLRAQYPYQALYPSKAYDGCAILSRYPIVEENLQTIGPDSFPLLFAKIAVPGKMPHQKTYWSIVTVHTATPMMLERFNTRSAEMKKIAAMTEKLAAPVVLCGDFNCVPWSQYFAALEKESGLRNSIRGFLPELTWNEDLPPFTRIPIDHMLVSPEVVVQEHARLPGIGSDHYPIMMKVTY